MIIMFINKVSIFDLESLKMVEISKLSIFDTLSNNFFYISKNNYYLVENIYAALTLRTLPMRDK